MTSKVGIKNYVAGFMFSKDERNVLVIEKQTPEWQRGLFNAIGGKLEAGETSLDAMIREFKEETGLETQDLPWCHFATIYISTVAKVDFFFVRSDRLYQAQTMEAEKVTCISINALPPNTMHNLHWLIPMALDKKLSFAKAVSLFEA